MLTEAEHAERERREREAAAAAEDAADTGDTTHSRPAEAGMGSLRAFCVRQQDTRQEWQRVVADQRSRNFTECIDPLSGAPTNDHSSFCQFVQSAMNPTPVDIISEAARASASSDDRGTSNTPEGRIRDRLLAARRGAGELQVEVCDPRVCQPEP